MVILNEDPTDELARKIKETFDLAEWEREAVRRGARLLDEVVVKWWEKVDIDTLAADSSFDDILGQVFGNYYSALQQLSFDGDQSAFHGFDSSITDIANPALVASFQRLDSYWKAETVERINKC